MSMSALNKSDIIVTSYPNPFKNPRRFSSMNIINVIIFLREFNIRICYW